MIILYLTQFVLSNKEEEETGKNPKLELRQVILFTRHGERTTVAQMSPEVPDLFPEDTERRGILTEGGKTQMRTLGKDFRSWLIEDESFLKPLDCPDMKFKNRKSQDKQIEVYSTTYSRTIESARAFLEGLFAEEVVKCIIDGENKEEEEGKEEGKPFDSIIEFDDFSFLPWDNCDLLSLEWNTITKATPEGAKKEKEDPTFISDLNNAILKSIKDKMHLPYVNSANILQAYDPLTSYKSMYGYLPFDITDEEYNELISLLKKSNKELLYGVEGTLDTVDILKHKKTSEYVRKLLAFGPMNSVLKELEALERGEDRKKFIYHSNHDLMLLAMLSNVSETDGSFPPFASHIEFVVKEDVNDNNKKYVAIKYNGVDVPISVGKKKLCEKEYKENKLSDDLSSHWCSLHSAIKDIRDEIPNWESGFFEKACGYSIEDLREQIEGNHDL